MMAFRENKNCTKRLQITNYQKAGKDVFENVEKNCFLVKFGTQQAKMITSFSANNEYGPNSMLYFCHVLETFSTTSGKVLI